MKNYAKPTLEIAKITTNEAIASGSPHIINVGVDESGNVPMTVYEISYAATSGEVTPQ